MLFALKNWGAKKKKKTVLTERKQDDTNTNSSFGDNVAY